MNKKSLINMFVEIILLGFIGLGILQSTGSILKGIIGIFIVWSMAIISRKVLLKIFRGWDKHGFAKS